MQNPVFAHSWYVRHSGQDTPDLRARFLSQDREWHEFVIVLNKRIVCPSLPPSWPELTLGEAYIYDPAYKPPEQPQTGRRALRSFPLTGNKAHKVLSELRTKRKLTINEVYIGGGGNQAEDCRTTSLAWVRRLVDEMVRDKAWDVGQVVWERVNNS